MNEEKSIRNILLLILIVVMFAVLRELASLIIPLVLAALLVLLNLPIVKALDKRKVPRFLNMPLVALVTLAIVFLIVLLISGTIDDIGSQKEFLADQLAKKIDGFIQWFSEVVPGNLLSVDSLRDELLALVSPQRVTAVIGSLAGSVGSFGSSAILFLLYYLLLLSGATRYNEFVKYVTGEENGARTVWSETQRSISAYMGVKTFTSTLTGVVAGLLCWAFGLRFALFWGFLTFLLNYIPSIGSIIATVFPVLMAVIQFDSGGRIIALGVALIVTQFLIGNVLDPMIMGSRLRLNTVTIIFGLLFWGYIWGVPGMLLSVPLMVFIRLLLQRNDDLAIVARVMGNPEGPEKGSAMPRLPIWLRGTGKEQGPPGPRTGAK